MITPQAFYDLLARHDWHHAQSDDNRAYETGLAESQAILRHMVEQPELESLYDQYADHVFSGELYGTPKVAKPVRPE